MASSPKEKFDAAVKVIRGLPKNGAFQPSHELMLKFYSYFKQATEGPCTAPKPGFWDLVNRKKWEAWNSLGNMPGEEAMVLYVEELKKVSCHVREEYYPPQIVETMPQTEAVTEFLQKLDNFYEMVDDPDSQVALQSQQPNGILPINGVDEEEEEEDEAKKANQEELELNHSYNVTQLLKQDLRRHHEDSGILHHNGDGVNGLNGNRAETVNGVNGNSHSADDASQSSRNDEGDNEDEEEEDERELEEDEAQVPSTGSQSVSVSDSETETEEFCDTSDEPLEHVANTSFPEPSNQPPFFETVASSTPVAMSKTVHFSHIERGRRQELSDSMFVNTSAVMADGEDVSGVLEVTDGQALDMSKCRGGDDEGERRRRGVQGGRQSNISGARGGHSGSSGRGIRGEGQSSGSGGRRGLYPGPGGGGGGGQGSGHDIGPTDLNEQIVVTLLRLQHDMSGVLNRLNSLEALVKEGRAEKERKSKVRKSWWPFEELNTKSIAVILVWPLVVHFVLTYIATRRRRLQR